MHNRKRCGGVNPICNAVSLVELAVEKGAEWLLMPVTCHKQLLELSDDMAMKIDVQFYSMLKDALLKSLME